MYDLSIKTNGRTIERIAAYATYMTTWCNLVDAAEGRMQRRPWTLEEAATALIEHGALDWEKHIRTETGMRDEPIASVAEQSAKNLHKG